MGGAEEEMEVDFIVCARSVFGYMSEEISEEDVGFVVPSGEYAEPCAEDISGPARMLLATLLAFPAGEADDGFISAASAAERAEEGIVAPAPAVPASSGEEAPAAPAPRRRAVAAVASPRVTVASLSTEVSGLNARFSDLDEKLSRVLALVAAPHLTPAPAAAAAVKEPLRAAASAPAARRDLAAAQAQGPRRMLAQGVDPDVAASAAMAGISQDELGRLGSMLGSGPSRLFDLPVASRQPMTLAAAEDVARTRADEQPEDTKAKPQTDPTAAALFQLAEMLGGRRQQGSSLDQALDGVGSSLGADGATGSMSVRRGASARRELEKALRDNPVTSTSSSTRRWEKPSSSSPLPRGFPRHANT
jgi:hypothetical protein